MAHRVFRASQEFGARVGTLLGGMCVEREERFRGLGGKVIKGLDVGKGLVSSPHILEVGCRDAPGYL